MLRMLCFLFFAWIEVIGEWRDLGLSLRQCHPTLGLALTGHRNDMYLSPVVDTASALSSRTSYSFW